MGNERPGSAACQGRRLVGELRVDVAHRLRPGTVCVRGSRRGGGAAGCETDGLNSAKAMKELSPEMKAELAQKNMPIES